jgi:CspA family cold shock protein
MKGEIKRLRFDRGFGFIQAESGEEVFFHRSAVAEENFDLLREGQKVTFDFEQSPRGPRASNVKVID